PLNKGFSIFKVIPLVTKYLSSSSLVSSLMINWLAFTAEFATGLIWGIFSQFPSCTIDYISNP
ncbi:MAG: hypothetical protein ACRD4W_10935, partial [Nitrososphaeraceae archaeon]